MDYLRSGDRLNSTREYQNAQGSFDIQAENLLSKVLVTGSASVYRFFGLWNVGYLI